jgi:hypothetical protein
VEFFRESRESSLPLQSFDQVFLIGDSLMQQLYHGRPESYQDKVKYVSIQAPLATDTVTRKFLNPIIEVLANLNHDLNTLVVLNSGVWDLLENGSNQSKPYMSVSCCIEDSCFDDHIQAMDELLSHLVHTFPRLSFAWKSMTAVHIHAIRQCDTKGCSERSKYMSTSRANILYRRQFNLLHSKYSLLHFIDLYNITFNRAHLMKENDGRHYKCDGEIAVSNMCTLMWQSAFTDDETR